MLAENLVSFFVKTDFESPAQLAMSWGMAVATLGFGIYAWMHWDWSFVWVASGIVSILLCVLNPFRWVQRRITGIIKRPSN
jgi:hypothetical protein